MGESGKRKSRQEEVPVPPSHRILTSDELGLLKVTEVPSGSRWEETAAKYRWGQPDKQQGVTRLQVHCPQWDPDRILVAAARCGGRVTLHCPAPPGEPTAAGAGGALGGAVDLGSFRAAPPATTSGRSDMAPLELRGLRFISGAEGGLSLRLVTATAGGHVAVHNWEPGQAGEADDGGGGGVVRAWHQRQWREVLRLQTVSDVQDMDVGASGRHVAVGGDGHQLRVWDLSAAAGASTSAYTSTSAPQPLFAAKAGKPSRSGLQDLAHVTAVSYVPGREDQLVLVGTAKHKLWLYDMRAGRKPQSEVVWGEGRITALLPLHDGSRVWVGNGRGQVEALDLRQAPTRVAMGHALKGSAGAIRSLSLHPSQPLIASVSLDRHLRVHSTTNRQLLTKVYLKQALTGVSWLPPPAQPSERGASGGEEDEEGAANGHGDGCGDGAPEAGDVEKKSGGPHGDAAGSHKRRSRGGGKVRRGTETGSRHGGRGGGGGAVEKSRGGGGGKDKSQKRRRRQGDV